MDTHPGTVGELLDKLPPVEGEARTARIDSALRGRPSGLPTATSHPCN
jgi:hypothetical protein